jgi:hypothetical protein
VAGRVLRQLLYWNFVGNGSAMMFRKSAALECGGYETRVSSVEEVMLQLKLASKYECAVTPEYLVGYRKHPGQQTSNAEHIYCGWLQTLELAQNECEGAPERVINWKRGELHFISAVRAYYEGRLSKAVQLLGLAHQYDPSGTRYRVCYWVYERGRNLSRYATRVLFPARTGGAPFLQARTNEIVRPNPSLFWNRRLEYLRQLDSDAYPAAFAD